jgi:hypothetical protein
VNSYLPIDGLGEGSRITQKKGIHGMRILAHGLAVAMLMAGGAVVSIGSPAAAINCNINRDGNANSTTVSNTSGANKCYRVRARIDRYYGSAPVSYLGAIDDTQSYVTSSNGYLISHYSNKSLYNGDNQIWDGWSSF